MEFNLLKYMFEPYVPFVICSEILVTKNKRFRIIKIENIDAGIYTYKLQVKNFLFWHKVAEMTTDEFNKEIEIQIHFLNVIEQIEKCESYGKLQCSIS